jgi:2-polyprenyl-3-methyl-5-hydroxy-6-metoxy-1,4-benzoquinol methylase
LGAGRCAVDLGAGFGMHAVPLARRGCSVLAVDTSESLLEELKREAVALPVRAVLDDLLAFPQHLQSKADAILCMGDTLTHLPNPESVLTLIGRAAETLNPGGTFVTTFRDYSVALTGAARFIPVRNDSERILTCFLEYGAQHVDVHDQLHELDGPHWKFKVSVYRKLRLTPAWVGDALRSAGFSVRMEPGLGGMIRMIAAAPL